MKQVLCMLAGMVMVGSLVVMTTAQAAGPCSGLPSNAQLRTDLINAASGTGIAAALGAPGSGVGAWR